MLRVFFFFYLLKDRNSLFGINVGTIVRNSGPTIQSFCQMSLTNISIFYVKSYSFFMDPPLTITSHIELLQQQKNTLVQSINGVC